jgi:hypothetical protein
MELHVSNQFSAEDRKLELHVRKHISTEDKKMELHVDTNSASRKIFRQPMTHFTTAVFWSSVVVNLHVKTNTLGHNFQIILKRARGEKKKNFAATNLRV